MKKTIFITAAIAAWFFTTADSRCATSLFAKERAAQLYTEAISLGCDESKLKLARCYLLENNGVERNYDKAFTFISELAEADNSDAMWTLGTLYEYGHGVWKDEQRAFRWYQNSAEAGNAIGLYEMGRCYSEGIGTQKNEAKSDDSFKKAFSKLMLQSSGDNEYNKCWYLGLCFCNGNGVSQDYGEAARWWRMAAEQGDVRAQHNLGCCYENGWGVSKDVTEAVRWLKKSAEQGDKMAKYDLKRLGY